MSEGVVVSIHIAEKESAPVREINEARLVPGRGIEGDRYYLQSGAFSDVEGPARDVTLIESEALSALEAEQGIKLEPGESRRNVTTSGVSLNDLLDREFFVGEVRLRGVKLSEPCQYLEDLLKRRGLIKGLARRGGLRCAVLTEGTIRPGDAIKPA
jgi:MOSC domain-containing protein YiiM